MRARFGMTAMVLAIVPVLETGCISGDAAVAQVVAASTESPADGGVPLPDPELFFIEDPPSAVQTPIGEPADAHTFAEAMVRHHATQATVAGRATIGTKTIETRMESINGDAPELVEYAFYSFSVTTLAEGTVAPGQRLRFHAGDREEPAGEVVFFAHEDNGDLALLDCLQVSDGQVRVGEELWDATDVLELSATPANDAGDAP